MNRSVLRQRQAETKSRLLHQRRDWPPEPPEWHEECARELLRGAQRRAEEKCVAFDLDLSDIEIPELCPVLGIALTPRRPAGQNHGSPSLDRIVPSEGYVRHNVAVISLRANRLKSDATPDELRQIADWMRSQGVPTDGTERECAWCNSSRPDRRLEAPRWFQNTRGEWFCHPYHRRARNQQLRRARVRGAT